MVLALAVLVPFLGKAYTIDDVTFLLQAKQVLVDPLHPTAFDMVFHGVRLRLSRALVTGPVMAYLLVPSVLLGGSEVLAHAIEVVMLLFGVLATGALALRLGLSRQQSAIAALLVVASPAVLGMAATAMPDVPAMAFAVAGAERALAWLERRSIGRGGATALLLALGMLSRPHIVLLLPCIALLVVAKRPSMPPPRRSGGRAGATLFAPIVAAAVIAALVIYATRDPMSGETVARATVGRVHTQTLAFNLASFAVEWAVAFPLVLLWPLLRGSRFLRSASASVGFAFGIALGGIAGYALRVPGWSIIVVLLCGLSAAVLMDLLWDAWIRPDKTQLSLGLWLLLAVPAATYVQLPPKILVPSAPAMAILIAREFGSNRTRVGILPLIAGVIGIGATVSVLVIRADAALAEIGRVGGRLVSEQVHNGVDVWMDGAWGYQWYAMAAGARALAVQPPFPHAGDIVVAGLQARLLRTDYPRKTLLSRYVYDAPGGRVLGDGAGFFTNWAGPWPWAWGSSEVGRVEVWRIDPPLRASQ